MYLKALIKSGALVFASMIVGNVLLVSSADAAPDLRVGTVDLRRALESSNAGSKAQQKFDKEVKKAQKEIESKKRALQKEQQAFVKQRESLSDSARRKKQDSLIANEKELKRLLEDYREKLGRQNDRISRELLVKIRKVVSKVGKEEGFTVILEQGNNAILYTDKSVDITDKVIKRFNSDT